MAWFRHPVHSLGQSIDYRSDPHTGQLLLKAMTISWSAAPTTSENMTVTLDSELGQIYNTEIYVVDPSTDSLTAVLLTDINLPVFIGDAISITYNNTDGAEIGIQIILTN